MAKYYGKIGYAKSYEVHPGIYEDYISEKEVRGDIIRNTRQIETKNIVNGINVTNQISIIADPFIVENMYGIRYITFLGQKWTVESFTIEYPRLILSLGGLYIDEHTRVAPTKA